MKPTVTEYRVKYYCAKRSRKGQGVWIAKFSDQAKAEAFAAENQIYARPCTVETREREMTDLEILQVAKQEGVKS